MTLLRLIQAARAARIYTFSIKGWWVRARVFGRPGAPRVVLVHGLGVSGLYLIPTAVELADQFEVWVPDLPGFGASGRPSSVLDISQLSDAVAGILQHLGDGPIPLLGNSLGCQILVDLAARYPERAGRLVLVGPTIDPRGRSAAKQFARLLLNALREEPSLVVVAIFDYLRAGFWRIWRTLGYALADSPQDKLPLVEQPTLVVRGARDPIVPRAWVDDIVRLLPNGTLCTLPNAAHAANYGAPRQLADVVRPFISPDDPSSMTTDLKDKHLCL
jgi:2-hydroxy-6-oxonona-2,4-dienedioate hydrolase